MCRAEPPTSGSGKSTLLALIGALDTPDSGTIRLGGADITGLREADRAAGLPAPQELIDWLHFVRNECPECQGETR